MNFGRFRISAASIGVCVCIAAFFGPMLTMIYASAALIHELGHLLLARVFGMTLRSAELMPFGCRLDFESFAVYGSAAKIATAAAGPAANIIAAAVSIVFFEGESEKFISANTALAAVNLIPALPLDGGHIICELLRPCLGDRAERLSYAAGAAAGGAMVILGIVFFLRGSLNLTLPIFGTFLASAAIAGLRSPYIDMIRASEQKKDRIGAGGALQTKVISTGEWALIGELIGRFDRGRYNIVYVLDSRRDVKAILTEDALLRCALKYGSETAVGRITYDKTSNDRDTHIRQSQKHF